jgi:methyl-accepting chemotaxis protein
MNWMTYLSMKLKMGLVVGLFTVVIAIFATILFSEWGEKESFSQKELHGAEFYQASFDLVKSAQLHRGNGYQVAKGKQSAVAPMEAAEQSFENALQSLLALEKKYAGEIELGERLNAISQEWQIVKQSPTSMQPQAGFAAHSMLIEKILSYVEFYSDQSNLTLDPEVDTFYLMQLLSFTLPRAIEYTAQLRGEAAGAIASGTVSDAGRNSLIGLKPIAVDKVEESLRSAIKASDSIGGVLDGNIKAMRAANEEFATLVQQVIDTRRSDLDSRQMFAKGTDLVSSGYQLAEKTIPELQALLQKRVDDMKSNHQFMIGVLVVIFIVALVVSVLVIRMIVQALSQANGLFGEIQQGNLDSAIEVNGTDELAQLLGGIHSMQNALRDNRQREQLAADELAQASEKTRKMATESKRLADALTVCDTSIMIADEDFNIVFMNHAVTRMMENRQTELSNTVPNFNINSLMGSNMDIFHKDPSHQRSMVSRLQKVYRTEIQVDHLTFQLIATPLFDESGNRTATIVEWEDLTDQLAIEQEQQRIANENMRVRIALDNSSTNTMIADADNNIVYMNSTLQSMMSNAEKDLRKDLPDFQVAKLMGQNMDAFHKNPAHQKNVIGTLTKTFETQINVGGRFFRLIASPVMDAGGNRLGTVVEWNDRTQEVLIENEVSAIVSAASKGDFTQRLPMQGKQGFFANLGGGLNQLMQVTHEGMTDVARVLSALAAGDLTQKINTDYEGLFLQLKNDANATVDKLEEVIANIIEASSSVTTGANEIASGNSDLSQRTEEQASSLEQTASSMEEMTSTVQQTSDNAQHANQLSQNAVKTAESGGAVVKNAVEAMAEINSSSKRIADIIGVIDEIAFQTNLLALNAAVEAARAGEQGRGFAVVAGEVRNLAQRSAGAAKEIKDLIRDSVAKVEAGTDLVNRSGETLSDIVQAVKEVTAMIGDINSAAREQSSSIVQINQAVTEMDEMTQQNAALVEQASAAGEAMADQASALMDLVGFFQLDHVSAPVALRSGRVPPAPAKAAAPERTAVSSRTMQSTDDEWEEF